MNLVSAIAPDNRQGGKLGSAQCRCREGARGHRAEAGDSGVCPSLPMDHGPGAHPNQAEIVNQARSAGGCRSDGRAVVPFHVQGGQEVGLESAVVTELVGGRRAARGDDVCDLQQRCAGWRRGDESQGDHDADDSHGNDPSGGSAWPLWAFGLPICTMRLRNDEVFRMAGTTAERYFTASRRRGPS